MSTLDHAVRSADNSVDWVDDEELQAAGDMLDQLEAEPKMDDFTAAMIAEGAWDLTSFEPSEENFYAALQHLIDRGLSDTLQGSIGRACYAAIDAGECTPRR